MPRVRKDAVVWVEPRLVAEVEFSEWTHDGRVRQPSYKGLRDDKAPPEVRRERPVEEVVRKGRRELRLSNLDKVFWPDEGIDEGRPARLLPRDRAGARAAPPRPAVHDAPLPGRDRRQGVLPEGRAVAHAGVDPDVPRARLDARAAGPERKWVDFPLVNDELALLWMANMGCIDMNTWYSRIDRPDRPDFVLFDLDPTPEVPWAQTVEVALLVRELLDGLGLASFPKTSGGKGFHVLVPLDRRSTYDDSRAFAEHVARAIARTQPELATTEWAKARRRGVLIDANQNGEGKTIASAYSVRPRPGAPVSTPLSWDEVDPARLDPAAFTMAAVLARVERHGDLFAPVLKTRQSLSKALARLG